MFKKRKGQGALEYLLLIGGAVLIAVIVIALLVSMSGQSRESAQDHADRAQTAMDTPSTVQIISIEANYSDCNPGGDSELTLNWSPTGEGGTHKLYIVDSLENNLEVIAQVYNPEGVAVDDYYGTVGTDDSGNHYFEIDPRRLTLKLAVKGVGSCGDSYRAEIKTTKNARTVSSGKKPFSWK